MRLQIKTKQSHQYIKKRENKIDRLRTLLISENIENIKSFLSDYKKVTNDEAENILGNINKWGSLEKATLVIPENKNQFDKGHIQFMPSSLQFTNIHFGVWRAYKKSTTNTYLRLGLLFKDNSEK